MKFNFNESAPLFHEGLGISEAEMDEITNLIPLLFKKISDTDDRIQATKIVRQAMEGATLDKAALITYALYDFFKHLVSHGMIRIVNVTDPDFKSGVIN